MDDEAGAVSKAPIRPMQATEWIQSLFGCHETKGNPKNATGPGGDPRIANR